MTDLTNYPRQDGFETSLASGINSTVTSMTLAEAPSFTLSSGTLYVTVDPGLSTQETMEVTAISSATLTITRGKPAYEGGASTATTHPGGAVVRFTNTWNHFNDIKEAIASKLDESGGVAVTPITDAVYANVAAFPAVSNGMSAYATAEGAAYDGVGGAWVAREAGGTFANASETVAGKVEIATTGEFNAGTDTGGTGATLSVIPSMIGATTTEITQLSGTTNIGEADTFFGATDITGAQAETLTDGSDASALHIHNTKVVSAQITFAGDGDTTIAHGLGRIPSLVNIEWMWNVGETTANGSANGVIAYDGTTVVGVHRHTGTSGTYASSNAIPQVVSVAGSAKGKFTIKSMDATNVTYTISDYAASGACLAVLTVQ